MPRQAIAFLLLAASSPAWAHGGHGLPGESHWHAADALGFAIALGLGIAGAWWFSGRGKK